MSAHDFDSNTIVSTITHVFCGGIEKRSIFDDEADFEVFLRYLEEYLSPPEDSRDIKQLVTIRGRSFKGTPHQPNNFFNQIELIAFSLAPDHFHLVISEITPKTLGRFIKSLCTRYAIYYNKRHRHKGRLFDSPYKPVDISDLSRLLFLTHYLHRPNLGVATNKIYSSYDEYLNNKQTPCVKPEMVLSYLNRIKDEASSGIHDYKDFVEKYDLDTDETNMLASVMIDKHTTTLEGITTPTKHQDDNNIRITTPQGNVTTLKNPPKMRFPEIITALGVFLILVSFGLRNIHATEKSNNTIGAPEQQTSKVAGISTAAGVIEPPTLSTEGVQPEKIVVVRKTSQKEKVIIFQNATSTSDKIGEAEDGDRFKLISLKDEWYEVELTSGATGFIFDTQAYLEVEGQ